MSEILFVATADTTDVDRKLDQSADKGKEYSDRMVSYGEYVEDQFKKTSETISAAIAKQKQEIASLQLELDKQWAARNKTRSIPKRNAIDADLNTTEAAIGRAEENLSDLEKQLVAVNGQLAGSDKLITDWAEGFVSGTDAAGKGMKDMAGAFLNDISKQEYILNSMSANINKIKAVYNNLKPGPEKDAYKKILDELNEAFTKQLGIIGSVEKAFTKYFSTFSREELESRLKALKSVRTGLYAKYDMGNMTEATQPQELKNNVQEIKAAESALKSLGRQAKPATDAVSGVGKAGAAGMKGLIGGAAAAYIGLAALAVIGAIVAGIIKSNRVVSDQFKVAMGGLSGALREAGRAINEGDWDNFWKKLKNGAEAGTEFAKSQMYIKARIDESKVSLSDQDVTLAMLNDRLKNGGLIGKERADLEAEIFRTEKAQAAERVTLAKERIDDALLSTKLQKQYTQDEIKELIKLAPAFQKNRQALEEYYKAQQYLATQHTGFNTINGEWEKHNNIVNGASDELVALSGKYEVWRKDASKAYDVVIPLVLDFNKAVAAGGSVTSPEEDNGAPGSIKLLKKELADLITARDQATTDMERKPLQLQIDAKELEISKLDLKALTKEFKESKEKAAQLWVDIERIREVVSLIGSDQNESTLTLALSDAKRQYDEDIKNSNNSQKVKYAAWVKWQEKQLEAQKLYFEEFNEFVREKQVARADPEDVMGGLVTIRKAEQDIQELMQTAAVTRDEGLKKEIYQDIDTLRGYIDEIKKLVKDGTFKIENAVSPVDMKRQLAPMKANFETTDEAKANQDQITKDAEEELKIRMQIADAIAGITSQLAEQIGVEGKAMDFLNQGLTAAVQLASGDWLGATISMVSTLIALIPTQAAKLAKQVEVMNRALEEQARLIQLSERTGGQEEARKKELQTLKELAKAQENEYKRLKNEAETHVDLLGWRQDAADKAYDTWKATTNQIEDANIELEDFYAGNIQPENIADAISQGFQDGKKSAADFAETFNDFMRQAIDSALMEMSKQDIAAWYKKFAEDMASGGLTDEEIAALKVDWDALVEANKVAREEAYKIAGMSPTGDVGTPEGLSGGIRRDITEETGNLLAGLMRKISDDNRQNRDYNKLTVDRLVNIEAYSYDSMNSLKAAVLELKAINSNTTPVYAGDL